MLSDGLKALAIPTSRRLTGGMVRPWLGQRVYVALDCFRSVEGARSGTTVRHLDEAVRLELGSFDSSGGYSCFVIDEHDPLRELVRSAFKLACERYGYVGWSDSIDRTYDRGSTFFLCADPSGQVVASLRATADDAARPLPVDHGRLETSGGVPRMEPRRYTVEINSFAYVREHSACFPLLFSAMGRWSNLCGFRNSYCLLDPDNRKVARLYGVAGYKAGRDAEVVQFPSFGRIVRGQLEPTRWTVLQMSQARMLTYGILSFKFFLRLVHPEAKARLHLHPALGARH